jgi:hypothetical protein
LASFVGADWFAPVPAGVLPQAGSAVFVTAEHLRCIGGVNEIILGD